MKESQQVMFAHSEVKVRLLRLYLERYLNIISLVPSFGEIFLYDLFCGEGIYENGGKGSPVIILETIKQLHDSWQNKQAELRKIHCYFNDIEEWKTNKLKAEIGHRNLYSEGFGTICFDNIDYREIIDNVANKVSTFNKEKAFVFIDPYGYKDIRVSDIRNLLNTRKAEVLLFLPTQFMFRFESRATPESLKQFIDELVPSESWPTSDTGIDFINNLTDAFRNVLPNSFVDSFIITRDLNQFFCLFFFTSHIYGFDRMLDAKWEIDEEEGRGWHYATDNSLFSVIDKQANTVKFERELAEYIKDSCKTNAEIYSFTLHRGHLPKHATEILSKFQIEGKLNIQVKDDKFVRKGVFYINYKDYRDNKDRIKIKMR